MTQEPFQPSLFPEQVYLQKIVPAKNQRRFYAMTLMPNLFGEWTVMREWGRIGSPGRVRADIHPDPGTALSALGSILEQKCRRGYQPR